MASQQHAGENRDALVEGPGDAMEGIRMPDTVRKRMPVSKKSNFQLVREIKDNVWLAKRVVAMDDDDDKPYFPNELFIARRLEEFDEGYTGRDMYQSEINGMATLMAKHNMMQSMAHILNHENIVSLAGHISQEPHTGAHDGRYNQWLVSDFCDAGNLETLLTDKHLVAKWEKNGRRKFLPEALCWHVLVSMLRALVWLHDGRRSSSSRTGEFVLEDVDKDWMPILHGKMSPENIMFQHPRGRETYGMCKLANFSSAFVSGKYNNLGRVDFRTPASGVVAGLRDGKIGTVDQIREALYLEDTQPPEARAYTVNNELWDLGAIIYRMMTNRHNMPSRDGCEACNHACTHLQVCRNGFPGCRKELARMRGCECPNGGCVHMFDAMAGERCDHPQQPRRCPHEHCDWKEEEFFYLDGLWTKSYSAELIEAVGLLMRLGEGLDDVFCIHATSNTLAAVEGMYMEWKKGTGEGRAYVDIVDDLLTRREAAKEGGWRGCRFSYGGLIWVL